MKTAQKIFTFLLLLVPLACSSKFKVASEPPEAEVAVIVGANQERKVIGKTPLEMPATELSNFLGGQVPPGEFFTLQITKNGFAEKNLSIPATRYGTNLTLINVKLAPDEATKKNKEEMKSADDILKKLFLAQKMALANQHERALIELDKILEKFPGFARALSMKGSIYFAQQKYEESLKWYEEALRADPQMEDTIKITAKVRDLLAGRRPASR